MIFLFGAVRNQRYNKRIKGVNPYVLLLGVRSRKILNVRMIQNIKCESNIYKIKEMSSVRYRAHLQEIKLYYFIQFLGFTSKLIYK